MDYLELQSSGVSAWFNRLRKRLGLGCRGEVAIYGSPGGELELCEACLEHRIRAATAEIAAGKDGKTLIRCLYRTVEILRQKGFDGEVDGMKDLIAVLEAW